MDDARPPALAQHAFGRGPAFTVGVEEELILVDPHTGALAHAGEQVLAAVDVEAGEAKEEFYAALIELASPICRRADEAAAAVGRLRAAVRGAGGAVIGSGLHPDARAGDVRVTPRDRYVRFDELIGPGVHLTPEAALHVHVGMPDPQTAIRVFNGLREHLPLLQALAANSPFRYGADSTYASARYLENAAYPRFELPRSFADYDDWLATADALLRAAELDDHTALWWYVRPHPRHGTVEVRIMDSQASLSAVSGLAALVHGLALAAADAPPARSTPREALAESLWRASRFGLDARLLVEGSLRPAREAAALALELARPRLRELGGDEALAAVERIVRDGNGADEQRAAHGRGGMAGLLGFLVQRTAAGLDTALEPQEQLG